MPENLVLDLEAENDDIDSEATTDRVQTELFNELFSGNALDDLVADETIPEIQSIEDVWGRISGEDRRILGQIDEEVGEMIRELRWCCSSNSLNSKSNCTNSQIVIDSEMSQSQKKSLPPWIMSFLNLNHINSTTSANIQLSLYLVTAAGVLGLRAVLSCMPKFREALLESLESLDGNDELHCHSQSGLASDNLSIVLNHCADSDSEMQKIAYKEEVFLVEALKKFSSVRTRLQLLSIGDGVPEQRAAERTGGRIGQLVGVVGEGDTVTCHTFKSFTTTVVKLRDEESFVCEASNILGQLRRWRGFGCKDSEEGFYKEEGGESDKSDSKLTTWMAEYCEGSS